MTLTTMTINIRHHLCKIKVVILPSFVGWFLIFTNKAIYGRIESTISLVKEGRRRLIF